MAKKKPGRPAADDPREPFNLRLRKSIIDSLRNKALNEDRTMNVVAERILEKALA